VEGEYNGPQEEGDNHHENYEMNPEGYEDYEDEDEYADDKYAHLESDMKGLNLSHQRNKKNKKSKSKAVEDQKNVLLPFEHWDLKSIDLVGKGTSITGSDDKEVRHGQWKFVDKTSKKIVKSGGYSYGKVSGKWSFFDMNGNLTKISEYIESKDKK